MPKQGRYMFSYESDLLKSAHVMYCLQCNSLTCTQPKFIMKTGHKIVDGVRYSAGTHMMSTMFLPQVR